MKKILLGFSGVLMIAAIVASCGKGNVGAKEPQVEPPKPTPNGQCDPNAQSVSLALFARTDCQPCSVELPDLNNRIKTQLADKTCRIRSVVYMTDSNANQEMADSYGKQLGIDFPMGVDAYCRGEYRKYWNGNCVLPAAALLSQAGEVIKVYPKGKVDLDDLMAQMKQRLN